MIIRSEEIYKKANSIVKSCGTRDTLKIARELGIHLHFLDNLNDLLGMYTYRHKERHILLNSNMEYLIMQMVCGHEIGHDTFHRDLAKGNEPLPEFVLFDMRTKHEYEANAFASHLIIDDDELIDLMKHLSGTGQPPDNRQPCARSPRGLWSRRPDFPVRSSPRGGCW